MESQKKMAMLVFGLVAAVFLNCSAATTVHVVGDGVGWSIPKNGAQDYVTWASTQTFLVDDVLIFNFATNAHDVVQVPKESFDSCSSTNAITSPITTGPANFTLTATGVHYYICSYSRHCQSGQKLAVTVSASATSPGLSPSSAPTPISTTSQAPTSSDAPCPPTSQLAPSPLSTKAGGPATSPGTFTVPPSSSSSKVRAGLALSSLTVAIRHLF